MAAGNVTDGDDRGMLEPSFYGDSVEPAADFLGTADGQKTSLLSQLALEYRGYGKDPGAFLPERPQHRVILKLSHDQGES